MDALNQTFTVEVEDTKNRCAVGEKMGTRNMEEGRIPVLSCEGACIRGEIARLSANLVGKEEPYARACHGELLTVPNSAMAKWVKQAPKVILIDGCFIRCHGRILENSLGKEKLVQFDALAVYKKYTDIFDIEDVPEKDRNAAARQVADSLLAVLSDDDTK